MFMIDVHVQLAGTLKKSQQFKSRCGESTIKTQKPGIIQAEP